MSKESNCQEKLMQKVIATYFCIVVLLMGAVSAQAHNAKSDLSQFRKLPPELRLALGKAESFAEKKLFTEARDGLVKYAAAHPFEKHPLFFYELGYFCHCSGDTIGALANLQKAVESEPNFKDAWQLLGIAWQESGNLYRKDNKKDKLKRLSDMQKGALAMDKAAQLTKDNNLWYQCALMWLEGDKPRKALVILEKLGQGESPKQEWLVAQSEAFKVLRMNQKTAETMEKAARVKNDPALLYHAAWLWVDLGKSRRALPLLQLLAEKKKPEKNWLLLLVTVYNTLQQPGKGAVTLEQVIVMDPAPDYLYNCGLLWLQDNKPDNALRSLFQLSRLYPLKADWFVATAQAWLIKENVAKAADAMERAASLSANPDHIYKAGALRLQLRQADRAIALLEPLTEHPKPQTEWMVALANCWLLKEDYENGARYMERAAVISGKGKLYHRAAMLWRIENKMGKTIELLKKSIAVKNVKQVWLVDYASVLIDVNREDEVSPIMARTNLDSRKVSPQLRYRGAVIWLNVQEPSRAYPLLKSLCVEKVPSYSWMSSLVKTCVELDRIKEAGAVLQKVLSRYPNQLESWKLAVWYALQQGNYVGAAAAKEIVRQFEPEEQNHLESLSQLYLLAGVPVQSARLYKKSIGFHATIEENDHLVDIYLSGRRYEQALEPARELSRNNNSPRHWESLGDIYYALHRYGESYTAYKKATELSGAAGVLLKTAYAAMKAGQLQQAGSLFKQVINQGNGEEEVVESSVQNLAYIKRLQERNVRLN